MRNMHLLDWIQDSILNLAREPQSAHWNEIRGLPRISQNETRLEVIRLGCQAIHQVVSHLKKMDKETEYAAVCFIPIDVSESMKLWDKNYLSQKLGKIEPVSIYLTKKDCVFSDDDEEYRKFIGVELFDGLKVRCIYRCFRSRMHMEKNWEFSSGLYLLL